MAKSNVLHLFSALVLLSHDCWALFWLSPSSRLQTLDDCVRLKQSQSAFYPPLCDSILTHIDMGVANNGSTAESAPLMLNWGWKEWSEWRNDGCPSECGRRCRIRVRTCNGPYKFVCAREGKAYELENCEGRDNNNNGNNGGGSNRDDDDDDDNFQRGSDEARNRNGDDDRSRNGDEEINRDEEERERNRDNDNEKLIFSEEEQEVARGEALLRKGIRKVRKLRRNRSNNNNRRDNRRNDKLFFS